MLELDDGMDEDQFIQETARLCDGLPPYFIKGYSGTFYLITQDGKTIINLSRIGRA